MVSSKRKSCDGEVEEFTLEPGLEEAIKSDQNHDPKYHANDPLIVRQPKRPIKHLKRTIKQSEREIVPEAEQRSISQIPIATARRYQIEVLDKALQSNTIAYLETGCGKTLIAVLLVKKLGHLLRDRNEKVVAVFLAPTVWLVEQQTEVLKINTDLKVDSFYGAKSVDNWNNEMWQMEIKKNEVLVMTPQVFLDALRHSFIKMDNVELLILDECHHTQKHHAYAKIMKEYYHTKSEKRPKVFGMTASPVIKKGVSSVVDCAEQMQRLESMLDAKVYTLKDRVELESYVPTPVQRTKFYDTFGHSFEAMKQQLDFIMDKYQEHYNCIQPDGDEKCFRDDEELAKKLRKRIRELHGCLLYCLEELGLWCAYTAAKSLLKTDTRNEVDIDAVQNSKENFLWEASQILETGLEGKQELFHGVDDVLRAVETGLLTPKVLLLVQCLLEYRDVKDMRCIVFVERVVTAVVLTKMASHMGCLSFLNCGFLAGVASSLDIMGRKQQQHTIKQFRAGRVNVLVATDVAEEGLDVQSCNSVIRFDLPKSVRSFIQSRGRARRPGSDYIIFLQRNNGKQEARLLGLIQSEESMRAEALNRPQYPASVEKNQAEGMDFYRVDCTGASVNTDSSISLIYRFCSKLPGDKYYLPRPEFSFGNIEGEDGLYVCRLILPPNGPFRELLGPPKRSHLLAKQAVCLDACKKLHHMEQITDHLLPTIEIEKPEEEEVMNLGGKKVSGAGTRKRKELHSTADIGALHGDWINSTHDVLLQAYIVSFSFTPGEDDLYSDVVLFIDSVIDDDIANTEIPLFLTRNRTAKAKISAVGNYSMSADQLKEAKAYHELVFNGVFGKLIMRNKKTDTGSSFNSKNLLASRNMLEKLWVSSHMYLLLPLISGRSSEESCVISVDWKTIRDSAITAQRFSGLVSTEKIGECVQENQKEFLCRTESDHTPGNNILYMACGPMPFSQVRGMAVVTIHTGKVYSVMEILQDKNADCAMEGLQDPKDSNYDSYAHYFRERYGKVLKFPQQPLLQLKQTHRVHNLLTRHTKSSREKDSAEKAKEDAFVEIPPELCLLLGISNAVIRSLYLVPSVMHRFNALLLAGQLRCKIAEDMPQCVSIRSSQVMEALTTLRCLEGFSFEALELLGDSFLKYAVSRYLFLFYDKKHEGQLSARRCRAICNATLHRLAAAQYLPEYIRDEPFEPRQWFAPGMHPRKAVMCKCNLNNLASFEDTSDNEEHKADTVFRIGKTCNKGHRWICSKTISDVVEALIGAYLVDGSTGSALGFMKWMGMEIEFDMSLVKTAMVRSAVHPSIVHGVNIAGLETELGYVFQNKTLLVEAFTHASQQDPFGGCCYQRLEFLGDAVLDFLITQHLFSAHPGLTPGILSDLRSAAVNNECFARSAVKHNLQRYLRHGSGELLSQITTFVRKIQMTSDKGQEQVFGWEGVRGPKVLGDLVESVAGAILVDSGFDLEKVWTVMKPLLSPIVTPSTLPLHPIRELHELSHYQGFSFSWKKTKKEGTVDIATAEVRLENELITKTAQGAHKKSAQKDCALQVLLALKSRGFCHPRRQIATQGSGDYFTVDSDLLSMYPGTKKDVSQAGVKHSLDGEFPGSNCKKSRLACDDKASQSTDMVLVHDSQDMGAMDRANCSNNVAIQRHERIFQSCMNAKGCMRDDVKKDLKDYKGVKLPEDKTSSSCHSTANLEINEDCMLKRMEEEVSEVSVKGMDVEDETSSGKPTPLDEMPFSIEMLEKGGGRSGLHKYCTTKKWKQPVYELSNQEGKPHSKRFTYSVVVYGPNTGPIRRIGDPMPSKKRAMDDAAVKVLLALMTSETYH